jgi:hypothetical protein
VETLKSQSAEFSAFFKRVQNAINAAVARGETESSDRFIQEAFGMRPNESSGDPK